MGCLNNIYSSIINYLTPKNSKPSVEELREKGVKEVWPGVFEFPFINTPKNLKKYHEFEEEYGRQVEELRKKRERLERKFEAEFYRKHPFWRLD